MSLVEIFGALGGAATLIALGRVLFASGKITRIVEETHSSVTKLDGKLDDHGIRIAKLEVVTGLYDDQRHFVRRIDDQVLRDVRKMANGEDL